MANYSVVKIELIAPPGTEYKVFWDQKKHDHGDSTATGTWAIQQLATSLGKQVTEFNYRSGSFQSNQSSPPVGKNIFEVI